MNTIYTAGYARWTPEQLRRAVLDRQALLIDIRYSPRSSREEWGRGALVALLGSRYRHEAALGNRNYKGDGPIELAAPERAVPPLAQALASGPVVLLCACADYRRCHRSVAADFLSDRLGAPVSHLEPPRRAKAAPCGGAESGARTTGGDLQTKGLRLSVNPGGTHMTDQPTVCAVCGGAFLDHQAIEWPEGIGAEWAIHRRIQDCTRVALTPAERRAAAEHYALGAPFFGAWVVRFVKATKRTQSQALLASLTRAAREELGDWRDYSREGQGDG